MPRGDWEPDDDPDDDEDWSDDESDDGLTECPYCGEEMYDDSPRCPNCGRYLSVEDGGEGKKPPWVMITRDGLDHPDAGVAGEFLLRRKGISRKVREAVLK